MNCGPGWRSQYSDSLLAGRPRDQIPVGEGRDFSAPVQTDPGAHLVFCTMGTGSLFRGKEAGAWRQPPTPI